jgi:hypothetical protein
MPSPTVDGVDIEFTVGAAHRLLMRGRVDLTWLVQVIRVSWARRAELAAGGADLRGDGAHEHAPVEATGAPIAALEDELVDWSIS